VLNVSLKRKAGSYNLISKVILKKFGKLTLKSLGNASQNVVALAESLVRKNLAIIQNIKSDYQEVSDKFSDSGMRSEICFEIQMTKSAQFDELTKDLK
jgi:hypothetical protein